MYQQIRQHRYVAAALALAACSLVLSLGAAGMPAQQGPLTRIPLLRTQIPGSETREAVMVRVELAPDSTAGKHYHHGIEIGYVLGGTALLEVDGKAPVTLKAGEAFQIDAAAPHNVSTRQEKLTVISVYLVERDKPLAEPVN